MLIFWLIIKNTTKDADEEMGRVWRIEADSFRDLSQDANLWGSADVHLLSEPCLLVFWGDLIAFLNDDIHIARYWARVYSDANRLTLRKPNKAGYSNFSWSLYAP